MSFFLFFVFSLSDFDANNIFKAFFGGPGGFSFEGNSCKAVLFFYFFIIIHYSDAQTEQTIKIQKFGVSTILKCV